MTGASCVDTFLSERIKLVRSLAQGADPRIGYSELALIVCAVLSACAAHRWPGRGNDRRRFIELLVRHSDIRFSTAWVSIPALLNARHLANKDTPYGHPGHETRIFCDAEIDLSLEDAQERYASVDRQVLRNHCYAALIYERIRCAYVHEYRIGNDMITVPASRRSARVSYIGRGEQMQRMVHFHLDYLIDLADHHVSMSASKGEAEPSKWWIDGP